MRNYTENSPLSKIGHSRCNFNIYCITQLVDMPWPSPYSNQQVHWVALRERGHSLISGQVFPSPFPWLVPSHVLIALLSPYGFTHELLPPPFEHQPSQASPFPQGLMPLLPSIHPVPITHMFLIRQPSQYMCKPANLPHLTHIKHWLGCPCWGPCVLA